MHAIYRQNLGFTHFIIGRKHADAPYDDKSAIWGDFDAQEIFKKLGGELAIHTVNVGFAAYFEEIGRVGLVEDNPARRRSRSPAPRSARSSARASCPTLA